MEIKPIKSETDYEAVLAEIETLMDAAPNTPEGDRLEVLATLAEAYEAEHHPIAAPDPIEIILHRMEALGMTRKDLEPLIGTRARVSEILARKRPLTIAMIRRLSNALNVPADLLIKPYKVQAEHWRVD